MWDWSKFASNLIANILLISPIYIYRSQSNKIHDDKLRIAKKGINEKDYEFSFDIFAAQQFLIGNGVRQENINFLAPCRRSISNLKKVDLIISFTSWFWHYPCETYWDSVIKVLHSKSALMVDMYHTYADKHLSLLRQHFIDVNFQEHENSTLLRVCAKTLKVSLCINLYLKYNKLRTIT